MKTYKIYLNINEDDKDIFVQEIILNPQQFHTVLDLLKVFMSQKVN